MDRSLEMEINGERWAVDESGAWLRYDGATSEWQASPEGPGAIHDDVIEIPAADGIPRAPGSVHDAAGGPLRPEVRVFHEQLVAEAQAYVDEPVLACGLFSTGSGLLARGLESAAPLLGRMVAGRLPQSANWALVLVAVTWAHVYVFGVEQDESPFSGDTRTTVTGLLETWERTALALRPAERTLGVKALDRLSRAYVIEIATEGRAVTLESVTLDGRMNDEVIRLLRDQEEPA